MNAEKFLESKKLLRVVGGKPIMVVSVKNAIIAIEIAYLEGKINSYENMDEFSAVNSLEEQLQALKTKHSIS